MKYEVMNQDIVLDRERREYTGLMEVLNKEFAENAAWILFWEQYRVDFAWYDGTSLWWPEGVAVRDQYLMEARIFNKVKEVHVRNCGGSSMLCRILEEKQRVSNEEGITQRVFAQKDMPYMWGTLFDENTGCISEERGMHYHLPYVSKTGVISIGYEMIQYYLPDDGDGVLHLMDYRISGIWQEEDKKKSFLNGGGTEDGSVC